MKGVQFSAPDEIFVDQRVNGMAIAIASLIDFKLPAPNTKSHRALRRRDFFVGAQPFHILFPRLIYINHERMGSGVCAYKY